MRENNFIGMPTIVPTPEIVRVNIERSVTLQCRAIGYPLPKIAWHRNGIPIDKLNSRVKILPDGSLLINSTNSRRHIVVILFFFLHLLYSNF